jgi:predicted nucleic acid-binding protein
VFQEILHGYTSIHRTDAIQPAFKALLGVVDEIFPVELNAVQGAKNILLGINRVSARNALHIAIMQIQGVSRILTFDSAFETIPGIVRLR